VPNYPALSSLWWQYIGRASDHGEAVPQIMQELAQSMDLALAKIGKESPGPCSPKLIAAQDAELWLAHPGSPKTKLDNEKPAGKTLNYTELLKQWQP
jgi:glycerol transport system substrate-binding protein